MYVYVYVYVCVYVYGYVYVYVYVYLYVYVYGQPDNTIDKYFETLDRFHRWWLSPFALPIHPPAGSTNLTATHHYIG